MIGLGVLVGFLRSHDLSLAITQIRFAPMLAAWMCIGLHMGRFPDQLSRACWVMFWIIFAKSLLSLFVFYAILGGTLGEKEYLVDHLFSLFTGMAIVLGIVSCLNSSLNPKQRWVVVAAMAIIFFAMLINDRRTAFLGLFLSLSFLLVKWFSQFVKNQRWLEFGYMLLWIIALGGFAAMTIQGVET